MTTARSDTVVGPGKMSKRRKYLGDVNDPHFMPSSPIITRQTLTSEQEEELARSCTLVLNGVQHADETEEDPLMKYITNQLVPKQTRTNYVRDRPSFRKPSVCLKTETDSKMRRSDLLNEDTATPSMASKRDTIDRTNTSTPLTFLSDTLRKSSSSKHKDSRVSQSHVIYAHPTKSRSSSRQQETAAASKSLVALVVPKDELGSHSVSLVSGKVGNISISQVEIEKDRPSLPHYSASLPPEKKMGGFARFARSAHKKAHASQGQGGSPVSGNLPQARTLSPANTTSHSRFRFASLFNRKRKPQQNNTIVS